MKPKTFINKILLLLTGIIFLSSTQIMAQTVGKQHAIATDPPRPFGTVKYTLGNDENNHVKIVMYNDNNTAPNVEWSTTEWEEEKAYNGEWQIWRGGKVQFSKKTEILAVTLKKKGYPYPCVYTVQDKTQEIDDKIHHNTLANYGDYPGYEEISNKQFKSITDNGFSQTNIEHKVTRVYEGVDPLDNKKTFTVELTVSYKFATPDIVWLTAKVDASQLAAADTLRIAYFFPSYVGGYDFSSAYSLPRIDFNGGGGVSFPTKPMRSDIFNLLPANLSKDYVAKQQLTAARTDWNGGAFLGYFPINTPFVKSVSATSGMYGTYMMDAQEANRHNFGSYLLPYANGVGDTYHLGVGVVYHAQGGEITTIESGMTFSTAFFGDLAWSWNNHFYNLNKTLTLVAGGVDTDFYMQYTNQSDKTVEHLKVELNMPNNVELTGTSETVGFNPVHSESISANAYSIDANIDAASGANSGSGNIKLPVHVSTYGKYVIDANSFSIIENALPLTGVATLTVNTSVGYQSPVDVEISQGKSAKYTVKLPDGVVAKSDLTVDVVCSGSTGNFNLPPNNTITITIPAGKNSAELVITAKSTATANSSIQAKINSTNDECVLIETPDVVTIRISASLIGDLDYTWNKDDWTNLDNGLNLTAGGCDTALYLRYTNDHATESVTNIGFRMNLPNGMALNGTAPSATHFTNFPTPAQIYGSFFAVENAAINPNAVDATAGIIRVPVLVTTYGEFVIGGSNFINLTNTNPLGIPATLSVSTTAGFRNPNEIFTVAQGKAVILTIKLPDGVFANGDLTVEVVYDDEGNGGRSAFESLPATVVIPSGLNSTSLVIIAKNTATAGQYINVELKNPNDTHVTLDNKNAKVIVKDPTYWMPVNRMPLFTN
jgi:hypothetical protein